MRKKKGKKHVIYDERSTTILTEEFSLKDGFIMKNDSVIGLATSGIVEAAAEGFLHVDETVKYETE